MTAYATDELMAEGLREGAVAVLTKPLDMNLLLGFFSFLRRERIVAIVDDDVHFCKTLADILRVRNFTVIQVTNPHNVVDRIGSDVQVVLLDMKLNNVTGSDILKEIRAQYPHVAVILVTGYREEMSAAVEAALEMQAYVCLYKPLQIEELLRVLTQVRHRQLGRLLEK
jgi:DNA-binding response OmpR family regulator